MGQTTQEFTFKTVSAPQTEEVGGANWEHIPLASFPPSFDVSIPDSFTNALSVSLSEMTTSFGGFANTLTTLTQNLQNASCSLNGLVDSLLNAQQMAQDFANTNNRTRIFVRPIGLQPSGTITSLESFMEHTRQAVFDTGTGVGQIPKVVPAEVPLDSKAIANALKSVDDGSSFESVFEGREISLGSLGVGLGIGLDPLSNNQQLISGFLENQIDFQALGIIREDENSSVVRISLNQTPSLPQQELIGKSVAISGSAFGSNNGIFTITGISTSPSFTLKIDNSSGRNETNTKAKVSIQLAGAIISTRDKVRSALQNRNLLQSNQRRLLPVVNLVDILIEDRIIGTNPDQLDRDRSIAIERLSRLLSPNNFRVGGITLVGQAPNLATLAAKITSLSDTLEFLKPAAEQLTLNALAYAQSAINPSGINFDPNTIELAPLESNRNIGILDAQSAQNKVIKSGILDFEMPELTSLAQSVPQPSPTNFNAWRTYSITDLIPGLNIFGSVEQASRSTVGNVFSSAFGTLGSLVEQGKASATDGLNNIQSQAFAIDSVVNQMNDLNRRMVEGLNYLKNQVAKNPFKVDAHLIGPRLDLLSNSDYVDSVENALRNVTDPNRPVFGPPSARSLIDVRAAQIASEVGVRSVRNTRYWFGVLIFIVGTSRKDLGDQIRSVADLLGMDTSAVDLPPQKKLSLTFGDLRI